MKVLDARCEQRAGCMVLSPCALMARALAFVEKAVYNVRFYVRCVCVEYSIISVILYIYYLILPFCYSNYRQLNILQSSQHRRRALTLLTSYPGWARSQATNFAVVVTEIYTYKTQYTIPLYIPGGNTGQEAGKHTNTQGEIGG